MTGVLLNLLCVRRESCVFGPEGHALSLAFDCSCVLPVQYVLSLRISIITAASTHYLLPLVYTGYYFWFVCPSVCHGEGVVVAAEHFVVYFLKN